MDEYSIFNGEIEGVCTVSIAICSGKVLEVKLGKKLPKANWQTKPFNKQINKWVSNYISGKETDFPYKFALNGTDFQKAVWRAMASIPFGQTRTYKWIAKKIGRPNAARAVGTACGANPLPLLIPCHRVVAATNIGGFSGPLAIKKGLLNLENSLGY